MFFFNFSLLIAIYLTEKYVTLNSVTIQNHFIIRNEIGAIVLCEFLFSPDNLNNFKMNKIILHIMPTHERYDELAHMFSIKVNNFSS